MFGVSITSILEKLASAKIAATAALASLILLAISVKTFLFLHKDEFAQIDWSALNEQVPKINAVLAANSNSKLLIAIVGLSFILVTSCCYLVVELIRLINVALKGLANMIEVRLKRDVIFYRRLKRQDKLSPTNEEQLVWLLKVLRLYPFLIIFFDLIFWLIVVALVAIAASFILTSLFTMQLPSGSFPPPIKLSN
jgi:hypothetical protein